MHPEDIRHDPDERPVRRRSFGLKIAEDKWKTFGEVHRFMAAYPHHDDVYHISVAFPSIAKVMVEKFAREMRIDFNSAVIFFLMNGTKE